MAVFILIFLLLLLAYIVIIGMYNEAWDKIPLRFTKGGDSLLVSGPIPVGKTIKQPYVSIIIAVRNEEHTINQLLSGLLAQIMAPANYEIIIVNDHSIDRTLEVAYRLQTDKVHVFDMPSSSSGKKAAIAFGINKSKGDLIITTDADCSHPPLWLRSIVDFYEATGAKFIAAPVKMVSRNTISGIFQRLDFLILQGITGASVHAHLHCMCNGANLAYEKRVYNEVNGFEGIDHIPSGDDLLLMYKIFRKYPGEVMYLKSKSAIVTTQAEAGWKSFLQQRIRWASKAVHYDDKRIFAIMLITYLVNVAFVVFGMITLFLPDYLWILFLFLLLKIITEYQLVYSVCSFFQERKLLFIFPLLQPIHIIYTVIAGWLGRFGSYTWKSRTVKNKGRMNFSKQ